MVLTKNEANVIVANSRKKPLEAWRRLPKRDGPTTRGRNWNLFRTISSFLEGVLCGNYKDGSKNRDLTCLIVRKS